MFRKTLVLAVIPVLGVTLGIGVLSLLGRLPVRFDNPLITSLGIKKPEIIGFLPYWLLTKADKDYTPFITTETYFGLTLDRDGKLLKLVNAQEEEPGWTNLKGENFNQRLRSGKKRNQKQSLLVISGDDSIISDILRNPETSAKNLVTDAGKIMVQKGFTDLNLDIESFSQASESARQNFTSFVRTVKKLLVTENLGTLTVDLIPISLVKKQLYDAEEISAIADRIVLMTYDYHYAGSFTTGAVAPVSGAGETIEYDVETALQEAVKKIPREKILLGIPLYGYEWETIDGNPGAATIPGGSSTASLRRIGDILDGCATCSVQIDQDSREPYLIYPENDYFNQIFYEDEKSLAEKIALAQKYRLGGVALWALGYEEYSVLRPLADYKNSFEFLQ